ncbi:dihydroneopterin aldolase [Antricoccus suffuscus]|uniref:7,8-dihydroneopterin aldolase n=1 Tax=Antricoccus suffuscus TaxID=1629062 RepID=A0A2T1A3K2_9ACTN|nr:dihydroneopterin aldolase [Antricoccus suffuscus]PRZ43166.1 dihydroneopterin aldolase [Antricoccus suffuscus]
MSDEIRLRGLTVRGHHGVFDFERRDGQDFVIDCTLGLDTSAAAQTDDVLQTVHYGELAEGLAGVVAGEPCNLIETLAQRLLDVALGYDLVEWAEIVVHKPSAPIPLTFADVAVVVRREKS